MRKRLCLILMAVWGMALLAGCGGETQNAAPSSPQAEPETTHETDKKEQTVMKMNVQIGGQTFTATLADTKAAQEFAQMLPMTITLDDYGGFEKVGSLGRSLTASNSQTTTTAGDIVLYTFCLLPRPGVRSHRSGERLPVPRIRYGQARQGSGAAGLQRRILLSDQRR